MYTISSHHVRDRVAFIEGNERLVLIVDVDPLGIIDELQGVMHDLKSLNDDSTDQDFLRIAKEMSTKIFGEKQTQQLYEFYNGNPKQFFNMVSKYFIERLNGLVTKAQKKMGRKRLIKK